MKDVIAILFIAAGIWFASELRHRADRRAARWGKGGVGPQMSFLSIAATSAWLVALGGAMLAAHYLADAPTTLEIDVVFAGVGGALVCFLMDAVLEGRKKKKA